METSIQNLLPRFHSVSEIFLDRTEVLKLFERNMNLLLKLTTSQVIAIQNRPVRVDNVYGN